MGTGNRETGNQDSENGIGKGKGKRTFRFPFRFPYPAVFVSRFLFPISLFPVFTGCASITAMQSAKTLAKDEKQFTYGVSISQLKPLIDSLRTTIPSADVMARVGLSDRDEFGFRVANLGTFLLFDYKRSIVANPSFYLSAGAAAGGIVLKDSSGESSIFDIYLPAYVDIALRKDLAIVFSPKYIFRTEAFHGRQVAFSGGLRLGNRQGFLVEAAVAQTDDGKRERNWQFMISRFKNRMEPDKPGVAKLP
jgi:hypothetical protein